MIIVFGFDIILAVQAQLLVRRKVVGCEALAFQRNTVIRAVEFREKNPTGCAVKNDVMNIKEEVSAVWRRDNKKAAQTVVMQIKGRNKVIRLKGVRVDTLYLYRVETVIFIYLSFFVDAKRRQQCLVILHNGV